MDYEVQVGDKIKSDEASSPLGIFLSNRRRTKSMDTPTESIEEVTPEIPTEEGRDSAASHAPDLPATKLYQELTKYTGRVSSP